ncbi:MAG: YwiC-like family protein [Arachnia sp.]
MTAGRKKPAGWVPQQHGAWAMIIVPFLTGLVLSARVRPLHLADATLGLTWLVGYFAFSAAVLSLKAAPRRRPTYYPALITYAATTAALGIATLFLRGWSLLAWVPVYAVLVGAALWLARSKRERSILSGVLTTLASSGLMAVLRLAPDAPAPSPTEWTEMAMVAAYFAGTVFHVKALIRERDNPKAANRSLLFHTLLLWFLVVAFTTHWLTWPWLVFALVLVARSWALPRLSPRPAVIGALEVVLSAALLALIIWA